MAAAAAGRVHLLDTPACHDAIQERKGHIFSCQYDYCEYCKNGSAAGPTGPFGRVLQFILFIVLRKLTRHIAWSCFVNRDKNELEAG